MLPARLLSPLCLIAHSIAHSRLLVGLYGAPTDIDIFLHSCTADEATTLTKQLFDAIAADAEHWTISRGRGVVSMIRHEHYNPNQRRHVAMAETVQV